MPSIHSGLSATHEEYLAVRDDDKVLVFVQTGVNREPAAAKFLVDVQGWELEILLGLDGVLRGSPAVRIVVEFWPGALRERGREPAEVLNRYVEMGYGLRTVLHGDPADIPLDEIVRVCDSGGPDGQVNLLLSR